MSSIAVELGLVAGAGAIVTGAIGYGFSSVTVPLALLFVGVRALNPALVATEVVLNACGVAANWSALPAAWRRLAPLIIGIAPGAAAGTIVLAHLNPNGIKLAVFAALLPMILWQAVGRRRPKASARAAGAAFGAGLGLLYGVTTLSGPPLAMALDRQRLSTQEFRAAMTLVRLAESTWTAAAYAAAGLFAKESLTLLPAMGSAVVAGVPAGVWIIRRVPAAVFRRLCLSLNAWLVSFGLSTTVGQMGLVDGRAAFLIMAVTVAIDARLWHRDISRLSPQSWTYAT